MICQECGADRSLTYRSRDLGLRSVCGPCIRKNHPETLQDEYESFDLTVWKALTRERPQNPVR